MSKEKFQVERTATLMINIQGMKRHGFSGQPASHGTSLTHRAMGSAGGSQGSGSRVHPGKKMPGRMGGQQHTVQNLRVLRVDDENGLVVVNGKVFLLYW